MPPQTKKEWTLMFYFASDNPLAPGIVSQLKAIKDAGYHPEANVIAQFDPHAQGAPTHVFDVNFYDKLKAEGLSNAGTPAAIPFVRNLTLDKLWPNEDLRKKIFDSVNANGNGKAKAKVGGEDKSRAEGGVEGKAEGSGNGHTPIAFEPPGILEEMSSEQSPRDSLEKFLKFCRDNYPARHYMLFILGHGIVVGNDLFLFDENAPLPSAPTRQRGEKPEPPRQNNLRLAELGKLLRDFKNGADGKPGIGVDSEFELLGFHSCSMSSLEVAYELQGTANYMLASQGPAFVGSWPYRQILVRLFKDLSSKLKPADLTDAPGLVAKLKDKKNLISEVLKKEFGEGTATRLLEEHDVSQQPGEELLGALLSALNKCVQNPQLCKKDKLKDLKLPDSARGLSGRRLRGDDVRRLNRMLLAEAYPEAVAGIPRIDMRELLKKFFSYILYNSHDFQLAGYSFDLCLSDLKKVPDLTPPLNNLASALTKGLGDEVAKGLILLAHWEAQSYWQETYTDLYDFCHCLNRRCKNVQTYTTEATAKTLAAISAACGEAMDLLKRPPVKPEGLRELIMKEPVTPEDREAQTAALAQIKDDGLVVAAKYAGPSFQYSHGFSVYFPWSKPTDKKFWEKDYPNYQFKETGWAAFLEEYFKTTLRKTHREEAEKDERQILRGLSKEEKLLEEITPENLSEVGQLGKGGVHDVTGKGGVHDPTGGDCDCPSIKNHPNTTASPNFFAGMPIR